MTISNHKINFGNVVCDNNEVSAFGTIGKSEKRNEHAQPLRFNIYRNQEPNPVQDNGDRNRFGEKNFSGDQGQQLNGWNGDVNSDENGDENRIFNGMNPFGQRGGAIQVQINGRNFGQINEQINRPLHHENNSFSQGLSQSNFQTEYNVNGPEYNQPNNQTHSPFYQVNQLTSNPTGNPTSNPSFNQVGNQTSQQANHQVDSNHQSHPSSSFQPNEQSKSHNHLNGEYTEKIPLITTTLTPFHLNCVYTNRRICHCSKHSSHSQQSFFRDFTNVNFSTEYDTQSVGGKLESDDISPRGTSEPSISNVQNELDIINTIERTDDNMNHTSRDKNQSSNGSILTHELYLMWKRRFPHYDEDVLRNQRRPKEDENGNILPNQDEDIQDQLFSSHSITGAKFYISVPKDYFDTQEKNVNETNMRNVDQRRKMERMVFVPLQKQDGQWLPMKWDIWRLEMWLRNVHGPEKAPLILRDMLQNGKVTTHEEVERIMMQRRSQLIPDQHPARRQDHDITSGRRLNTGNSQPITRITISQRPVTSHTRTSKSSSGNVQFTNLIPYNPQSSRR